MIHLSFAGNCASENVTLETINTQGGGTLSKVDVQIAVSRGAAGKRYDYLLDKESDADFFRCTLFGKLAEAFAKYYSKGRPVNIAGRLVINEFITKKNNAVIIDTANPLYNAIRPYVTDPQYIMADGSVVMGGRYVVKQPVINVAEFSWLTGNPNKTEREAIPSFNTAPASAPAAAQPVAAQPELSFTAPTAAPTNVPFATVQQTSPSLGAVAGFGY